MSIRIPLATYYSHRCGLVVELDDEARYVSLRIEGEGDTEQPIDRYLTPNEARELAAMLRHYATEAERAR
jgi:hypothetical protein